MCRKCEGRADERRRYERKSDASVRVRRVAGVMRIVAVVRHNRQLVSSRNVKTSSVGALRPVLQVRKFIV
jgi:hypothetical protein